MNQHSSRHTTQAILEPRLPAEFSPYQKNSSTHDRALCKISFVVDENEEKHIQIYPGMSTFQIAQAMCGLIGCDSESCVEDEVKNQL